MIVVHATSLDVDYSENDDCSSLQRGARRTKMRRIRPILAKLRYDSSYQVGVQMGGLLQTCIGYTGPS